MRSEIVVPVLLLCACATEVGEGPTAVPTRVAGTTQQLIELGPGHTVEFRQIDPELVAVVERLDPSSLVEGEPSLTDLAQDASLLEIYDYVAVDVVDSEVRTRLGTVAHHFVARIESSAVPTQPQLASSTDELVPKSLSSDAAWFTQEFCDASQLRHHTCFVNVTTSELTHDFASHWTSRYGSGAANFSTSGTLVLALQFKSGSEWIVLEGDEIPPGTWVKSAFWGMPISDPSNFWRFRTGIENIRGKTFSFSDQWM